MMRENAFSSIVSSSPVSGGATIATHTAIETLKAIIAEGQNLAELIEDFGIIHTLSLSSGRSKGNSATNLMCGLILSRLLICNSDMCGSFHFCHLSFYSDTAFCLYFGGSGELGQKRLLRKTRPTRRRKTALLGRIITS